MDTPREWSPKATEMDNGRQYYQALHHTSAHFFNNTLHNHDFYEIYIHVSGADLYQVENHTYHLKTGDMLIVKPYQMHGHSGVKPLTQYERLFLYITPEMLKKVSCGTYSLQGELDARLLRQQVCFSLTEDQLTMARRCLDRIQSNCLTDTPATQLHDIALLIEFLLMVLDCMSTTAPITALPTASTNPVHQIVAYINDHFDQPLSLDSIAAQFGLSKSNLSHRFVKATGHGVYDYILYCRFTYAKQLIATGEPLTSVAYRCGFGDYSNFQRTFSRFAGCSARAYRKHIEESRTAAERDLHS